MFTNISLYSLSFTGLSINSVTRVSAAATARGAPSPSVIITTHPEEKKVGQQTDARHGARHAAVTRERVRPSVGVDPADCMHGEGARGSSWAFLDVLRVVLESRPPNPVWRLAAAHVFVLSCCRQLCRATCCEEADDCPLGDADLRGDRRTAGEGARPSFPAVCCGRNMWTGTRGSPRNDTMTPDDRAVAPVLKGLQKLIKTSADFTRRKAALLHFTLSRISASCEDRQSPHPCHHQFQRIS